MIEWRDEGIILSVRTHGETSSVITLLTREHGRHAGLVPGGISRRTRGTLQPGNRVAVHWRARLAEQLGSISCELGRSVAPAALGDRCRLAAIVSACSIVETALPEREPMACAYERLQALVATLETDADELAHYARWEVDLLAELGFGLDLGCCALTGVHEGLAFVSPRSGRAVCAAAGEPWRDRLLVLPPFLAGDRGPVAAADIAAGLTLTAHFLQRHVYAEQGRGLPPARERLQQIAGSLKPPAVQASAR